MILEKATGKKLQYFSLKMLAAPWYAAQSHLEH